MTRLEINIAVMKALAAKGYAFQEYAWKRATLSVWSGTRRVFCCSIRSGTSKRQLTAWLNSIPTKGPARDLYNFDLAGIQLDLEDAIARHLNKGASLSRYPVRYHRRMVTGKVGRWGV